MNWEGEAPAEPQAATVKAQQELRPPISPELYVFQMLDTR
jgi:hypothetical protein